MDYRASKAWHYSHQLALEVHELVREVVVTDKVAQELAVKLKRASAAAPTHIKTSLQKELQREKLACYKASRSALEETHRYLKHSLKLNYIDKKFFKKLEKMATNAYHELGSLIDSTEKSIAQTQAD